MISITRASGGAIDPQRRQLFVGEAARLLGGPARGVDGAVDEQQRQREIVGDAFGAHVVEIGKRLLSRIVQRGPDLHAPRWNTIVSGLGVKFRRFQNVEIDRADLDLGARLPDEIAAENIRMQRADEDADPPQRHAGRDQPLAESRPSSRAGLAADLAPSISQSVDVSAARMRSCAAFAAQVWRRQGGNADRATAILML